MACFVCCGSLKFQIQTIGIALRALSESNVEPGQLTAEMCELATVEANGFSVKSPEEIAAIIARLNMS